MGPATGADPPHRETPLSGVDGGPAIAKPKPVGFRPACGVPRAFDLRGPGCSAEPRRPTGEALVGALGEAAGEELGDIAGKASPPGDKQNEVGLAETATGDENGWPLVGDAKADPALRDKLPAASGEAAGDRQASAQALSCILPSSSKLKKRGCKPYTWE